MTRHPPAGAATRRWPWPWPQVEAPALALMVPLLLRGLRERVTAIKRKVRSGGRRS